MPEQTPIDAAGSAAATPQPPATTLRQGLPPVILASTSRYRRELLERLGLPFDVRAPGVDETAAPGETPEALAVRLAREKARAVARDAGGAAIVIGSDQVAVLDDGVTVMGKPGTHERACAQLALASGRTVRFLTAVAVVDGRDGRVLEDRVDTLVRFRALSAGEIDRYLRTEQPYDCAGSAKSEGAGVALLEAMETSDPTALVGLPLIRVAARLRELGWTPFSDA